MLTELKNAFEQISEIGDLMNTDLANYVAIIILVFNVLFALEKFDDGEEKDICLLVNIGMIIINLVLLQ